MAGMMALTMTSDLYFAVLSVPLAIVLAYIPQLVRVFLYISQGGGYHNLNPRNMKVCASEFVLEEWEDVCTE